MFKQIFFPLFCAIFFLANPIFSQTTDQRVLESIKKADQIPDEVSSDTVIDGWQIRYLAEPQGTAGWQWCYTFMSGHTETNYTFNKNGKCVSASLFLFPDPAQPGGLTSILDATCPTEPPIAFEKTGLLPNKVDPHTQAIGEMDSTQTDLMALNLFGELVSLTDTINKAGSLQLNQFLFNTSKDGGYQFLSQNIAGQWYETNDPKVWRGDLTFVRPNEVVVSWFFEIKNETITLSHVSTKGKGRGSVLPDLVFYLKDLQAITGN